LKRERLVIQGCAIATVDTTGTEWDDGHLVVEGDRIAALGPGAAPAPGPSVSTTRIDGRGCLLTPGLVNTHHHLFQWTTRGWAPDEDLFGWLTALYPVWAMIDADMQWASTRAGLAALAVSGCTTAADHQYLFPRGAGELFEAEVEAARSIGLRLHAVRGSMDLGTAQGGLPPDVVTEEVEEALAATEQAIDKWHDPSPSSRLRVAVGPCSPFSASRALMTESAALARSRGVRLHTHLAETQDEETYCLERFGLRPLEYAAELAWLGPDVWIAHGVHLSSAEVAQLGDTATGVAHCPSSNARLAAGIAPVPALLNAGAPTGLGVDGAASNESGELAVELRMALLAARLGSGAKALKARDVLRMATFEGARCLGRESEIGSLEIGKLADVALWRMDDLAHAGIEEPITALVHGTPPRPEVVLVGGQPLVEDGHLVTEDEDDLARAAGLQSRRLRALAREAQ
jgi:8-oxoguanine deaminase